jgi:hypothetical protein
MSDYGYYGKDGYFKNPKLPILKCKCGESAILKCQYDDIPGFRGTDYMLLCKKCNLETDCTSVIEDVIGQWNQEMEQNTDG